MFTLVGVDGNAFAIMGYTANALKRAGLRDKVNEMHERATSGDYNNLIAVCDEYVQMANEAIGADEDDYDSEREACGIIGDSDSWDKLE